jgi:hypothetical protein
LVFGKVRVRAMPPHFWLWAGVLILGFGIAYWWKDQSALESQKSQVMAKQRALAKALGPQIFPFRDRVESWVRELAAPWKSDYVKPGVSSDRFVAGAGVYLRLRMSNALRPESIRRAAARSLHDGFTSCLFVAKGLPDPTRGVPCRSPSSCEAGTLCNEYSVCAPPPRPYNMRLAYRALRVLSEEWSDELHEADSELGIKAYDRDLDSVTRNDVPIAVQILTRAQYFTLVLDEDPGRSAAPEEAPDAGETDEERVQRVPHTARIGIWDLKSGEPVLKQRAKADVKLYSAGGSRRKRPETAAAERRQANSCALALAVRSVLAEGGGGTP